MNPNEQHTTQLRPLLHRIHDVVRLTNVGRTTIYGEISRGRLRIVKLGRTTLIRDQDLQTWLNGISEDASHDS